MARVLDKWPKLIQEEWFDGRVWELSLQDAPTAGSLEALEHAIQMHGIGLPKGDYVSTARTSEHIIMQAYRYPDPKLKEVAQLIARDNSKSCERRAIEILELYGHHQMAAAEFIMSLVCSDS